MPQQRERERQLLRNPHPREALCERRAREEWLRGAGAAAAGLDLIAIDAAVVAADVGDGVAEGFGGAVVSVVGDAVASFLSSAASASFTGFAFSSAATTAPIGIWLTPSWGMSCGSRNRV